MVDILEVIRQKNLKSAKASISFGEATDAAVSQRAQAAKDTLAELNGTPRDVDGMYMRRLYYRMVDEYYASPAIRIPAKVTPRGLSLWRRVVRVASEVDVDPEAFMRAQFQYFHKAFGRPPKVYQLATKKARERALEFTGATTRKVVGNDIRYKSDIASIMRFGEKQMQDICRAQKMTREEVYRTFVVTGQIAFPKEYLAADPVYKKVIDG